jgi:hypothetical protein
MAALVSGGRTEGKPQEVGPRGRAILCAPVRRLAAQITMLAKVAVESVNPMSQPSLELS